MQGLLDAMELEGYDMLKPPCNNTPYLVNPDDITCTHGSLWNQQYSQPIMGGTLPGTNMKINDNDNFHPVEETNPVHLSEIDSDCAIDSVNCVMQTITVSQNIYGDFSEADTGMNPQAATEVKTKMSSRQKIQFHAGNITADFAETDETGDRCADINNASLDWAYSRLSAQQKYNYDTYGVKLVTGADLGPYNNGPEWIWNMMVYTPSEDG